MLEQNQSIPAIWVHTGGASFNAERSGYLGFLTGEQRARLERIRQARLLFDGKHREYFLHEQRTQFDFAEVRTPRGVRRLYLTYNVLGLISLKTADLLFGEEPLLRAEGEQQQAALSALVERSNLHTLFYGCAVDASYEAESFVEACVKRGQVFLRQVPADEIFPQGEIGPDGQYDRYVRYAVQDVGTKGPGGKPIWLLLETTYAPGVIERKLYQLEDQDTAMRREVSLDQWPMPAGAEPLKPVTTTGIDRNTITWVANLVLRGRAVSDYDGAIDLQDSLNAKNSQVARVLLKHADPKIAFPESAADEQGNVQQRAEAFFFRSKEEIPQYITWNGEIANAMADRAFTLNQLLVRTETSPVLLGLKEGAAPDAYKKVRLESFNSLTKAARKAAYWKAGIRRAVGVAQDLEQTIPGTRYDRSPNGIAVELRDGIPIDTTDQANEIAIKLSAHAMSRRRAVEEQLRDPAAVERELTDIAEDVKESAPSIFMGGPTEPAEGGPVIGAAGNTADATTQGGSGVAA